MSLIHHVTMRTAVAVTAAITCATVVCPTAEAVTPVQRTVGAPIAATASQPAAIGVSALRAGMFVDTGLRVSRLSKVDPRNMTYRRSWGLSWPSCAPTITVRRGSGRGPGPRCFPDESLSVGTPQTGVVSRVGLKAVQADNARGSLNSQSVYVFVVSRGRVLVTDLVLGSYKSKPIVSFRRGRLVVSWGACIQGGCGPYLRSESYALSRGRLVRVASTQVQQPSQGQICSRVGGWDRTLWAAPPHGGSWTWRDYSIGFERMSADGRTYVAWVLDDSDSYGSPTRVWVANGIVTRTVYVTSGSGLPTWTRKVSVYTTDNTPSFLINYGNSDC